MEKNDSPSSLMTRIDAVMIKVRSLRPDAFSLDDLDKVLMAMTMIRALSYFYLSLVSFLQLRDELDKEGHSPLHVS